METKEKLLLIDGFNLLSRCYFATAYGKEMHDLPRNSNGLFTNAIRVTIQKVLMLFRDHEPTHIAFAWDVKREETLRREKFADYKGTRNELPEPLIQQYETLIQLLDRIGITQLTIPRYEADDIIGTMVERWRNEREGECIIYSNDRDLLQLLCEKTSQLIAIKRDELKYTLAHFRNEYGITPKQWIDVKALLGDKSDNIPGVAGVGDKAALPLIQEYGAVEQIYENFNQLDPKFKRYFKKLDAGKQMAVLSKDLCTIFTDVPGIVEKDLEECRYSLDKLAIKNALEELEIRIRVG
jgi:5'-3' exonuclease